MFWLYEEYQDEKKSMETEIFLDVADQVIEHNGGDLSLIISELRNNNFDFAGDLKIDSIIQNRSSFNIRYMAANNGHPIDPFGVHIMDSLLQKQLPGLQDRTNGKTILFSNRMQYSSLDTCGIMMSGNIPIPENVLGLTVDKGNFTEKALRNIIPQILFAICLFGLLGLGIFVVEKANKKQRSFLESKNNFLSNMTHELKTPIATISVALEVLQNFNGSNDREKSEKYLTQSRKELTRLSKTIDQVMQVSKIDSDQVYQFQESNINQICQEVTDNLSIRLEQKNIDLITNYLKDNVMAEIEPGHFENMLFNLLDNAIKYGKEGGRIEVHLDQKDKKFSLDISDTGIGIDHKQQKKIFERFYRIQNGDTHNVKGTGLGLSYVKQVVDIHNGEIKVFSQIGSGSRFNISMPIEHA